VSYEAKKRGFQVYSNDILYSNYVIAKAFIENPSIKINKLDIIKFNSVKFDKYFYEKASFLSNLLYHDVEVKELSGILAFIEKQKGYKKFLFLSLLRRSMLRKIPYSRFNVPWKEIIKFRDEERNYSKYKRKRSYQNYTFRKLILDDFKSYNQSVFSNHKKNYSLNLDVYDVLKINKKYDVIYLDPPYPNTMNNYQKYYGAYDKLFNFEKKYTNFTKKNTFLNEMKKLIEICLKKSIYVVISVNNTSSVYFENFLNFIFKSFFYSKHEIKLNYQITGKINKNKNKECIFILSTLNI
jgi:adenine-specific DNA-methyltransferase